MNRSRKWYLVFERPNEPSDDICDVGNESHCDTGLGSTEKNRFKSEQNARFERTYRERFPVVQKLLGDELNVVHELLDVRRSADERHIEVDRFTFGM